MDSTRHRHRPVRRTRVQRAARVGPMMAPSPLRSPRLADLVAGALRERILSGELKDGETLARQEDLLEEFNVSAPSMREGLRILESEGLITVKRGNVGGAVVHSPPVQTAAYTMAMVLQARDVDLTDVAAAIQALEPVCASMCAARPDRLDELVPTLRRIHDDTVAARDDVELVSHHARRFHEAIVDGCGNETTIVLVGALELIWTAHATELAARADELPEREHLFSPDALQNYASDHAALIDAIEEGDEIRAAQVATEHLRVSAQPPSGSMARHVKASVLKSAPSSGPASVSPHRAV